MEYQEVSEILVEILRDAGGSFLFPYQIFNEIESRDENLARRLEAEYSTTPGRPSMGEGSGIYYSPASFIAHALNSMVTEQ